MSIQQLPCLHSEHFKQRRAQRLMGRHQEGELGGIQGTGGPYPPDWGEFFTLAVPASWTPSCVGCHLACPLPCLLPAQRSVCRVLDNMNMAISLQPLVSPRA